jgi:hypothetical protein
MDLAIAANVKKGAKTIDDLNGSKTTQTFSLQNLTMHCPCSEDLA